MAGKITAAGSPKAALRKQVLGERDALPPATRSAHSTCITRDLLALDAYRNAACVLAYMSFGSEFDTATFIRDALAHGKQLALPRVARDPQRLELHRVTDVERDLESGVWGIREPLPNRPRVELDRVDFVLLPGVAFTARCERLGYGGGYYDALIARFRHRPPLVAAAFSLQIRDEIPLGENDKRIDMVVTENQRYGKASD